MMKIKPYHIVIAVLLAAVVVLTIILINQPDPQEFEPFDPQPYIDTINMERDNAVYWQDQAHMFQVERDGLAVQKNKVIKVYEPQYIYIYDDADVSQLDSTIRANM